MLVGSQPEVLLDCRNGLGESVIWDDRMLFVTTTWFGLTEAQREKEPGGESAGLQTRFPGSSQKKIYRLRLIGQMLRKDMGTVTSIETNR
jgi:hypothetical protein